MSLRSGILKPGERWLVRGQTGDVIFVVVEDESGNRRTIETHYSDYDIPEFGMPGYLEHIKSTMPELPEDRRARYQSEFKLSNYDSEVITADKATADYFDSVVESCGDSKAACNWVMGAWMSLLNRDSISPSECPISAESLAELINLIGANVISHNLAKQIFEKMWDEKKNPREIIEKYDMVQKQDSGELEKMVEALILADQKALDEYRKGKQAIIGHFVGKTMKETKGKANPKIVNEIVKSKLESLK